MGSLIPKKVGNMEYRIEADSSRGMKVPVTIYADEELLQKMLTDRTITQAVNVSTLPGVQKHVVVLPDGHEGYGFPVGGDRKSTRLNSSHGYISYAVFCLKKKKKAAEHPRTKTRRAKRA